MKQILIVILTLMYTITTFAITPHGSRVDDFGRGHNSIGDGVGFLIVIALVVGTVFLVAAASGKKKSNNKFNSTSSSNYSASREWDERLRRLEKQNHDAEVGMKWGCGIPLVFIIIYILNYFFHFIN